MTTSMHRQKKGSLVWTPAMRRKLLKMCGYLSKEEMSENLGLSVNQVVSMIQRMGASYKVTKKIEDYIE